MTHCDDQHRQPAATESVGVIVSRPRTTDAIGAALDCAFAVSRTLPSEIAAQLHRLESIR